MCPSSTTSSEPDGGRSGGFSSPVLIAVRKSGSVGGHLLAVGIFSAALLGTLAVDFISPNQVVPVGEERREQDRREREASFWDGTLAELIAFKARLHSRTRTLVLPPLSAMLLSGFGHTTDRVVLGNDGYLFHGHTLVERARPPHAYLADTVHRIKTLAQRLKAWNVGLLVVPVPTKAMTMSAAVPKGYTHHLNHYEFLLRSLSRSGIECVDLRHAFAKHLADGQQVFLRADSHWTQLGALSAALAVASAMKIEISTSAWKFESAGVFPDVGNAFDVLGMSSLGLLKGGLARWILESGGHAKEIQVFNVVDAKGQPAKPPKASANLRAPNVLIGSSFSLAAGFKDLLAIACEQAFRIEAVPGGGGLQGWRNLLRRGVGGLPKKVVWEVPMESLIISDAALMGIGDILAMMPFPPGSLQPVDGCSLTISEDRQARGRAFDVAISMAKQKVGTLSGDGRVLRLLRAQDNVHGDVKIQVLGLKHPWSMVWPKGLSTLAIPLSPQGSGKLRLMATGVSAAQLKITGAQVLELGPR